MEHGLLDTYFYKQLAFHFHWRNYRETTHRTNNSPNATQPIPTKKKPTAPFLSEDAVQSRTSEESFESKNKSLTAQHHGALKLSTRFILDGDDESSGDRSAGTCCGWLRPECPPRHAKRNPDSETERNSFLPAGSVAANLPLQRGE